MNFACSCMLVRCICCSVFSADNEAALAAASSGGLMAMRGSPLLHPALEFEYDHHPESEESADEQRESDQGGAGEREADQEEAAAADRRHHGELQQRRPDSVQEEQDEQCNCKPDDEFADVLLGRRGRRTTRHFVVLRCCAAARWCSPLACSTHRCGRTIDGPRWRRTRSSADRRATDQRRRAQDKRARR